MDRRRFLGMVPLAVAVPVAAAVSFTDREVVTAPAKRVFTPDEVKSLNAFQRAGVRHPYTCGGNHRDAPHLDGEGVLVATEQGWICLYCDYTQDWASAYMKNWRWKEVCALELEAIRRESGDFSATATSRLVRARVRDLETIESI